MAAYREHRVSAPDGLQLYYRDYDGATGHRTPVVCLAGLTRNSRDFEDIATHLSATRRVVCPDMRGRGRSAYDPNWKNYAVPVEANDVLSLLTAAGLAQAIVIGTSRGGLLATVLAALRPGVLKAVVLNDVGPELDPRGIARIAAYVGNQPAAPADWDEAVASVKAINGSMFEMSDAEWLTAARGVFRDDGGRPVLDHDPRIGDATRAAMGQPQLFDPWALFGAFAAWPLLAIRGANSDLLSRETLERMHAALPHMHSVEIADRGHAPFLNEPDSIAAIDAFLAGID